jgi:transcriptional regulator with XRE-family HTH domain
VKALTRRLRVLRAERQLSQITTARLAGMKEYRYWRIEAGYSVPTDQELGRIARALKTSVDDLRGQAAAGAR